jgi:hypothetical protein
MEINAMDYVETEVYQDTLRANAQDVMYFAIKLQELSTSKRQTEAATRLIERAKRQLSAPLLTGSKLAHRLYSYEKARLNLQRALAAAEVKSLDPVGSNKN